MGLPQGCDTPVAAIPAGDPDLYPLVITGSAVSVVPLIVMVLLLQRFWRADLLAGGLKG